MKEAAEALSKLWRELRQMGQEHTVWIGLDDYSPASGEGFDIPENLPDEALIAEQLDERERLVQNRIELILAAEWPAIRELVPLLLNCLSPVQTIRLAETVSFDRPVHAPGMAGVLLSRVLNSATYDKDDFNRLRPLPRWPTLDSIETLADMLQGRLHSSVAEEFEKQFLAYREWRMTAEANDNMHGENAGSHAAVQTAQTVIVHGTWASGADWWREPLLPPPPPHDNLWAYLQQQGIGMLVKRQDAFAWSGSNSDAARRLGAEQFVDWWKRRGKPLLNVIAHSHGGNVVMMAAAMEPTLEFRKLILLGTPARVQYVPHIRQTQQLTNIYSIGDLIQVGGSWGGQRGEGRTQSDHASGTNLHLPYWSSVSTAMKSTGHSDLHEPAFWDIHKLAALLR